jgi:hypothetical protein
MTGSVNKLTQNNNPITNEEVTQAS